MSTLSVKFDPSLTSSMLGGCFMNSGVPIKHYDMMYVIKAVLNAKGFVANLSLGKPATAMAYDIRIPA